VLALVSTGSAVLPIAATFADSAAMRDPGAGTWRLGTLMCCTYIRYAEKILHSPVKAVADRGRSIFTSICSPVDPARWTRGVLCALVPLPQCGIIMTPVCA